MKSAEKYSGRSIEIAILKELQHLTELREDLSGTVFNMLFKVRTNKHNKVNNSEASLFKSINNTFRYRSENK